VILSLVFVTLMFQVKSFQTGNLINLFSTKFLTFFSITIKFKTFKMTANKSRRMKLGKFWSGESFQIKLADKLDPQKDQSYNSLTANISSSIFLVNESERRKRKKISIETLSETIKMWSIGRQNTWESLEY